MAKYNQKFARKKDNYTEEQALQDILTDNNLQVHQLTADHTLKMWHWTPTETEAAQDLFTVEKSESYEYIDAVYAAMEHFDTFEANIQVHDEDETRIVFSKIRG